MNIYSLTDTTSPTIRQVWLTIKIEFDTPALAQKQPKPSITFTDRALLHLHTSPLMGGLIRRGSLLFFLGTA